MRQERTEHGFIFGDAEFSLCCSDEKKGWAIVLLETSKHKGHDRIQIYVTRTGKVRVFTKDGELKPK
jgi:hypothetical protein